MPSILNELDDLEHAVDLANKGELSVVHAATKCEAMATMARIRNKVDALDAKVLRSFERTREHLAEGHASPIGWMKHHARAKGPDASRRRRLARQLAILPLADQAMVAGSITWEHVEVLASAQDLITERLFTYVEEVLVDAAASERFSDFVRIVEYTVHQVAPAAAQERERRLVEDRWASSSRTLKGAGSIDAWMPPVPFTEWQAELDRLCDHLFEEDRLEARDRLGRRPLHTELRRTSRQRRVDAMHLMAKRSAALRDDDLGPSTYALVMHGDTELVGQLIEAVRSWADEKGVDLAEVDGADIDPDEVDLSGIELGPHSLHELDDGTVVCVQTLLLALLTGTIRGILYDPQGEVLRFGRTRRFFSAVAQTPALQARQRRCAHPYGCDRRVPFVQSDHVHEHQDGGLTDVDNGQLLCPAHNLWKTNQRNREGPPSDGTIDRGQRRLPPEPGPPQQPDE